MDYIWIMYFQDRKEAVTGLVSSEATTSNPSEGSHSQNIAAKPRQDPKNISTDPEGVMILESTKKLLDIAPSTITDTTEPKGIEEQEKPPEPGRDPGKASGDASTPIIERSWVPRCPHCGKANEYGYTMCDLVLPRICQGGDF